MLVGDIYRTDYNKIGLKSTTIASSFGKVFRRRRMSAPTISPVPSPDGADSRREPDAGDHPQGSIIRGFRSQDIARSLLYLIR